jgi:5-methylcytosine-specific restriction endonuclease McrA
MRADEITQEHLIPASKGGTYHQGNLCLVCRPCNSARGNDMDHPDAIAEILARLKSIDVRRDMCT